jgi:hypothetical protein
MRVGEYGGEIVVRGSFADQRRLVKIGCFIAFVAFAVFGSYIPTSLAVAVIGGVGERAADWKGTMGSLGFVAAMAVVGGWTNCRFLSWLRGGSIHAWPLCFFVSGCICCSTVVASIAVKLHVWTVMFIVAFVVVVVGLILSWVLISVGQSRKRPKEDALRS